MKFALKTLLVFIFVLDTSTVTVSQLYENPDYLQNQTDDEYQSPDAPSNLEQNETFEYQSPEASNSENETFDLQEYYDLYNDPPENFTFEVPNDISSLPNENDTSFRARSVCNECDLRCRSGYQPEPRPYPECCRCQKGGSSRENAIWYTTITATVLIGVIGVALIGARIYKHTKEKEIKPGRQSPIELGKSEDTRRKSDVSSHMDNFRRQSATPVNDAQNIPHIHITSPTVTPSLPSANGSGGRKKSLTGTHDSGSGGRNKSLTGTHDSVSGGRNKSLTGTHDSISGGRNKSLTGTHDSVSGGRNKSLTGTHESVSGGRNKSLTSSHESRSTGRTTHL